MRAAQVRLQSVQHARRRPFEARVADRVGSYVATTPGLTARSAPCARPQPVGSTAGPFA